MGSIRAVLDRILDVLAGMSLIAMTALTCWQVFTRYVLNAPSTWSEELVGYLFAWASLFGASLITGERGHMNIPVVVEKLPPAGRRFFSIFGEIVAMAFSAVILIYGGYQITQLAMGQMTSSLGVAVEKAKEHAENEQGVTFLYPDVEPFRQAVLSMHQDMLAQYPDLAPIYDRIQEHNAQLSSGS